MTTISQSTLEKFPTQPLGKEAEERLSELFGRKLILRPTIAGYKEIETKVGALFNKVCENLKRYAGAPNCIELIGSAATYCVHPLTPPGDIDISFEYNLPVNEKTFFSSVREAIVSTLKAMFQIDDEGFVWQNCMWKRVIARDAKDLPPKFMLFAIGPDKNSCLEIKISFGNFRKYVTTRDSFFIRLGNFPESVGSYALDVQLALALLKAKKIKTDNPSEVVMSGFQRYVSAATDGFSDDDSMAFRIFYEQFGSAELIYKALVDFHDNHHIGKEVEFEFAYYFNTLASIYLLKGVVGEAIERMVHKHIEGLKLTSYHFKYIQSNLSRTELAKILSPYQLFLSLINQEYLQTHLEKKVVLLPIKKQRFSHLIIPIEGFECAVKRLLLLPGDVIRDPSFIEVVDRLLVTAKKNRRELLFSPSILDSLEILASSNEPLFAYLAWQVQSLFSEITPSEKLLACLKMALDYAKLAKRDEFLEEVRDTIDNLSWNKLKPLVPTFDALVDYLKIICKLDCASWQKLLRDILNDIYTYPQLVKFTDQFSEYVNDDLQVTMIKKRTLLGLENCVRAEREKIVKSIKVEPDLVADAFAIMLKFATKENSFEELEIFIDLMQGIFPTDIYGKIEEYYSYNHKDDHEEFQFAYFFNALVFFERLSSPESFVTVSSLINKKLRAIQSDIIHIQYLAEYLTHVDIQILSSPYSLIASLMNSKHKPFKDAHLLPITFKTASIALPVSNFERSIELIKNLPNKVIDSFEFFSVCKKISEAAFRKSLTYPDDFIFQLESLCRMAKPHISYFAWRMLGKHPTVNPSDQLLSALMVAIKSIPINSEQIEFLKAIELKLIGVFGLEIYHLLNVQVGQDRTGRSLELILDFILSAHLGKSFTSKSDYILDPKLTLQLFSHLLSSQSIHIGNVVDKLKMTVPKLELLCNFEIVSKIIQQLNLKMDLLEISDFLVYLLANIKIPLFLDSLKTIFLELISREGVPLSFVKSIMDNYEERLEGEELGHLLFTTSMRLRESSELGDSELARDLFVKAISANLAIGDLWTEDRQAVVDEIFSSLSHQFLDNGNKLKEGCAFFIQAKRLDLSNRLEKSFTAQEVQAKNIDKLFLYLLSQLRIADSEIRRSFVVKLIRKAAFSFFDDDFVSSIKLVNKIYGYLKKEKLILSLVEAFRDETLTHIVKIAPAQLIPEIDFIFEFFKDSKTDSEVRHFFKFINRLIQSDKFNSLIPYLQTLTKLSQDVRFKELEKEIATLSEKMNPKIEPIDREVILIDRLSGIPAKKHPCSNFCYRGFPWHIVALLGTVVLILLAFRSSPSQPVCPARYP